MMRFTGTVLVSLLFLLANTSSINKTVSLAVTVYNDQFAIVKDLRQISFSKGSSTLYFTDVSTNIQPQTVTFITLNQSQGIKILQQNFQANLINTNSILQKYINKRIQIVARVGNVCTAVNGTLLGYNSGYILKTTKGVEVFNNIDSIIFPSLPPGFLTLPTLNWRVYSDQAITTTCEVAYRTLGFSWRADYSLTLNDNQTLADIGGWVTIDNNSGKQYKNAKLKLVAGDVNLVNTQTSQPSFAAAPIVGMASPSFTQKPFSDYHLYTLSELVTLDQNSQKQIQFITKALDVRIRKYYLISVSTGGSSQDNIIAANKVQFANSKENNLGIPLPKGIFRVYKLDTADDSLEFVGEDSINHTPVDQTITLTTGNAFDITANQVATHYQSYQNGSYVADLNLTVSNHKSVPAEIVVQLNNYNGDNTKITWQTAGLQIQQVNTNLVRIERVFMANQTYTYVWSQDYSP